LLAELQSLGVQLERRRDRARDPPGGAGPSDHMALSLGESTLMVPVLSDGARASRYRLRVLSGPEDDRRAVVEHDGRIVAEGTVRGTPRFYQLSTKEGIPYNKIALLHSKGVLASTVLQTCFRYNDPAEACQFCALGESLRGGRTLVRKTPEQLAEVAEAAMRLDGSKTWCSPPVTRRLSTAVRPPRALCAGHQASDVAPHSGAVRAADDFGWFERLRDAGADALGCTSRRSSPRCAPGWCRARASCRSRSTSMPSPRRCAYSGGAT